MQQFANLTKILLPYIMTSRNKINWIIPADIVLISPGIDIDMSEQILCSINTKVNK